jgi:hypothetical protein
MKRQKRIFSLMLHLVSEHDKTDVILILATLELDMMFCQPRDYNQTVCQPRNAVLRIMILEILQKFKNRWLKIVLSIKSISPAKSSHVLVLRTIDYR